MPTYAWDATAGVWKLTSGGLSAGVYIGDSPPANPVPGQLFWESDSGNTFILYNDGNSSQWVQFNMGLLPDVPSVPKVTRFTANGTWTPDPKMVHGFMWVKGGGGGGGGASVVATNATGCGGGAEGSTAYKYFRKSDITAPTYAVTVGAGGAAVSAGTGATGGDSSVGSLVLAKGSTGGAQYSNGVPQTGSIGDIVIPGAVGFLGSSFPTSLGGMACWSGNGGGAGGGQGFMNGTSGTAPAGNPGWVNSGGGGGGSASYAAGPGPTIGGAGGSGFAYIIEYCLP